MFALSAGSGRFYFLEGAVGFNFGFSYVGLIFLIMLTVPNIIWSKNKPEGYDSYAKNENKILLVLERVGEASSTCLLLISADLNIGEISARLFFLLAALALMILYEVFWCRYFRSLKTMRDFYASLLGIPVAGATLPVAALLLLGIYGGNILLLVSGAILGTGHIGIHLQHRKEAENSRKES